MPWISRREIAVRDRERDHLVALAVARDERVRELERQVDDLHRQGFAVSAPPAHPPMPRAPLPPAVQDVIDGLTVDREDRAAWEAEARRRLQRESPETVAATLFTGGRP